MSAQLDARPMPASEAKAAAAEQITETDVAAILGMMASMAILASLMLGIMMPVIFWVLSGVLGVFAIGCALFSRSNLRWWCLLFGAMGLVPSILFILVQALPTIQKM
mgnify:CR=1 FL=1